MAASTLITDYVGRGLAAARPTTPPVSAGCLALYYATDSLTVSCWDGSAWQNLAAPGGVALSGLTNATLPLNTGSLLEVSEPTGGSPAYASKKVTVANLLADGNITLGSTAVALGSTVTTLTGLTLSGATLSGTTTLSGMTAGSILFAGASGVLSQSNSALFWDNSVKALKIASSDAAVAVLVGGTTKGVRVYTTSNTAIIEGVDSTGVVSYQPMMLSGSYVMFGLSGLENARLYANGDFRVGTGSALATNATGGFLMATACAGAPSGVPANAGAGQIPLIYDTTNNKIWAYNGAWKSVVLT